MNPRLARLARLAGEAGCEAGCEADLSLRQLADANDKYFHKAGVNVVGQTSQSQAPSR